MEEYVNECCRHPHDQSSHRPRLPDLVSNGCQDSHLVANKNCKSASADTWVELGLMALVCWHDHPILLACIKGGSKKHCYALVLLQQLADMLPKAASISILYDIACQLSHGFEKWGYLPDLHKQLSFATLVFHAYVHQWACQAHFNPCKVLGFGMTNGKGCECLWSSMADLVPIQ
ncbi:hypothetical protein DACRYDRAFT_44529 [Dacryopinax primogenitus]|uniref:CxC2-like cysteine cluster KDZ transposase-associated domain-containing protein n=1 Tax=Dacryopinax primogenitus (strain DJM 731) TaxID=1858805 RepID=M5G6S9_DACPD|nr:uncharacterized protein DACRYDRAFT_44529 [Dacryopinax primogenitus]EJU05961.1 hypothetical protein DACRYDRAFT_44529 [Dacryopinax primogenitus]